MRMQNDWNKFGEDYFDFTILDKCKEKEIRKREQYYLDKYLKSGFLYNHCPDASSWLGHKHNDEAKKKMSEVKRGKKNPMYKKHHREESKQAMSKALSGEGNGNSKITEQEVIEILTLFKNKANITYKEISSQYGISFTSISNIRYGKRWSYLKEIVPELYD